MRWIVVSFMGLTFGCAELLDPTPNGYKSGHEGPQVVSGETVSELVVGRALVRSNAGVHPTGTVVEVFCRNGFYYTLGLAPRREGTYSLDGQSLCVQGAPGPSCRLIAVAAPSTLAVRDALDPSSPITIYNSGSLPEDHLCQHP